MDEAALPTAVLDGPGLIVVHATPSYQRLFPSAGKGMSVAQGVLGAHARKVLETGAPQQLREVAVAGGRLCDVRFSPLRSGDSAAPSSVLVVAVDVTERVSALREAWAERERLLVLDQATKAVSAEVEPRRELAALAASVVPSMADACAVYLWHPAAPEQSCGRFTRLACLINPALRGTMPRIGDTVALGPLSPIVQSVRRRRAVVTQRAQSCDPETWLTALPVSSLVAVPVQADGAVHAVVTFVTANGRPPFQASDISLLRELTARATVAVQQALRVQRTTEISLALQRSFLSDPPATPGMKIAVRYRPAGPGLEIGGDWYDALRLPGGGLGIAIGDVVGHDLPAATTMAQLRSMLQALVCQGDYGPADALTRLNQISAHLGIGACATLIYGEVTRKAGQTVFRWASAGHPPPLLMGAQPRFLGSGPQPLLGLSMQAYREQSVVLPRGTTLLLYTDGLVEHRRDPDDPYAALARFASGLGERSPRELLGLLESWASTDDDLALLALRLDD